MSYLTRKVSRRMKRGLRDGELVVNATPAARLGGMREYAATALPHSLGVVGTIAGSLIGAGGRANIDPRAAGSRVPLPQRCTVAVTNLRLLIFENSSLTNKPKTLVYEVPREQIEWIGEPVADPGLLTKTERVVIGVRGPAVVGWEVPRVYTRQGQALLAELARQTVPDRQQDGPNPPA
ncbi:hypothetical protein [Kitasatospora sp. NPDC101183]|uniref:hypothetical protein n=1 Tax=Kitasatospora sp. NPDC101183 TaxID=3364100 RepID=UPI00381EC546